MSLHDGAAVSIGTPDRRARQIPALTMAPPNTRHIHGDWAPQAHGTNVTPQA